MPLPHHTQTFTIGSKEIQLLVPDPLAAKEQFRDGNNPLPYWSQVWPAALGLASFLARNTILIQGRNVIELAAGLGLPSMFAAHYASHVVCSDYLEEATWFIGESAQLNELLNLETRVLNWHYLPPDLEAEVVLLSDVNYEPSEFQVLQDALHQLLQRGVCVILSTPQRLAGREFLIPLLSYCQQQELVTVPQGGGEVAVNVFVLVRK
jgi:predicted nicotinamide N-methyase